MNVTKTKWMAFHKARDNKPAKATKGELKINNLVVERVDSFKYLGVIIDSTLSFKEHEELVERRVNIALAK